MNSSSERLKTPITEQEVKEVIRIIKNSFSNRSPSALIIATYDYLQLGKLPSRIQKAKQFLIKHNQMNDISQPLYHPKLKKNGHQAIQQEEHNPIAFDSLYVGRTDLYRHKNHVKKMRPSRSTQSHATCMPPSAKQEKERILAEIFLTKGYGAGIAKAEISFSLTGNIYYSYIRSIIYRAFLKLTEVISDDCKLKLIQSEDYKTYRFKSWLCRCQTWLLPQIMDTFKQFIRSIYDLDAKSVSKGDAIKLYKALLSNWFAARNELIATK